MKKPPWIAPRRIIFVHTGRLHAQSGFDSINGALNQGRIGSSGFDTGFQGGFGRVIQRRGVDQTGDLGGVKGGGIQNGGGVGDGFGHGSSGTSGSFGGGRSGSGSSGSSLFGNLGSFFFSGLGGGSGGFFSSLGLGSGGISGGGRGFSSFLGRFHGKLVVATSDGKDQHEADEDVLVHVIYSDDRNSLLAFIWQKPPPKKRARLRQRSHDSTRQVAHSGFPVEARLRKP